MELKKRLRVQGANEVNAVLIYDEGEEYPVFLESLHNTVIFPTLLESGYKLTSLPYGFVKNGVSLEDLPEENYQVDGVQLELMYNSIGVKLPYDEIKGHVDVKDAVGVPTPPTAYRINTREEFIEYLESLKVVQSVDDFQPINYFVSPNARLTVEEFFDPKFAEYVNLMNNRRTMSLTKFRKLVTWLGNFGLSPNARPLDVIDAYFAWGFDGVNLTVMAKRREQRLEKLLPQSGANPIAYKRNTLGFADRAGNLYTPPELADVIWKPRMGKASFEEAINSIPMGEVALVACEAAAKQEVTVCECTSNLTCTYSVDVLRVSRWSHPTIRVESPIGKNQTLDINLAMPGNADKLMNDCLLYSLARDIYTRRKVNIKVSSFDVLTSVGCNPETALNYIARNSGYYVANDSGTTRPSEMDEDDNPPRITHRVITEFLAGITIGDKESAYLKDIIDGNICIDGVNQGKLSDASANIDNTYNFLYAINHVFGIDIDTIYEKVKTITIETTNIEFEHKGLVARLYTTPIDGAFKGYERDFKRYLKKRGQESTFFFYVDKVAKEVGDERSDRHVGVEFLMATTQKPAVRDVINELVRMYKDKVELTISNPRHQEEFKSVANAWAMKAFFEIASKGTYTFPQQLGGGTSSANPDMRRVCQSNYMRKIESLSSLCNFLVKATGSNKMAFNGHCVNAYITPTRVIPRKGYAIKAYPFYTLWCDWRNTNPGVFAQLVDAGILESNFDCWDNRYYEQQFIGRDINGLGDPDTLLTYYERAIEEVSKWPKDEDFVSVTHPVEYLYPGIYAVDKLNDKLPNPRVGEPIVRLGLVDDLSYERDYIRLFPSDVETEVDQYMQEFNGFTTEELLNVPDILSKIPSGVSTLVVTGDYIMPVDSEEVYNFRRIAELLNKSYPIVHLYDRKYLLLSTAGKVLEVQV